MVAQAAGYESGSIQVESEPDVNDAQAIATDTQAYEQALAQAFSQTVPEMGSLPVALYQFPIDIGEKVPEHCVCVELVHLQADKDNARLIPEKALQISEEESSELVGAVNRLVNPDGLTLRRGSGGRYYLSGMPATALDTWPAHAVANGQIANYLPRQSAAGDWRRLLTEVQMLFHGHPINVTRNELQKLSINGMWFWGGNQSSRLSPVTGIGLVADDVYSQGLARALELDSLSSSANSWSSVEQHFSGHELIRDIVIVDHNTYDAWLSADHRALSKAKQQLQQQWIKPIQQAVSDGLVSEFKLDGCEGQAIVERQASHSKFFSRRIAWFEKLGLGRFFANRPLRSKEK